MKFQSVEELQQKINKYFSETKEEEWTITGLALALDTTRDTLVDYGSGEGDRAEFSDTVKEAKEKVHNAYEKDLRRKGRSGDIFALKNFGWTDRQEIDTRYPEGITIKWQENESDNTISEAPMADDSSPTSGAV